MTVIYLAGTENDSKWREAFIQEIAKQLVTDLKIDQTTAFNFVCSQVLFPTNNKDLDRVNRGKTKYIAHVITPRMTGFMDLFEALYDSFKRSKKTAYCLLKLDFKENNEGILFDQNDLNSLKEVMDKIKKENVPAFENFSDFVKHFYPIIKGNYKS